MDIRKLLIPGAHSVQNEPKVVRPELMKPIKIKDRYGFETKVRRIRISDNAYREYYY